MTVTFPPGSIWDTRTPAEAVAYCDGYEAGLDQGRREAAEYIRAWVGRWQPTPKVAQYYAASSMRVCAERIEAGEADA